MNGWEREKENMALPGWLQRLRARASAWGSSENGEPFGEGGEPRQSKAGAAAAAGTVAAFGYSQSCEEDDRSDEQVARDDQMMVLTKKMIEIWSMLQHVGQSEALVLPSIVVI